MPVNCSRGLPGPSSGPLCDHCCEAGGYWGKPVVRSMPATYFHLPNAEAMPGTRFGPAYSCGLQADTRDIDPNLSVLARSDHR